MKVKGKAKIVTAFVLGLLLGLVGMFVLMGMNTRKVMAIYADAQLLEMAANARLLRSGQGETLLRRYDDAIPRNALYFHKHHRGFLKGKQAHAALWQVQRYYESNPSLKTPADIKPILDALPPRPVSSCEIKGEVPVQKKAQEDNETAEQRAGADVEDGAAQP